jgi:hypothetical protein
MTMTATGSEKSGRGQMTKVTDEIRQMMTTMMTPLLVATEEEQYWW